MSNNDLLSSLANLRNWRSVSFGIVHLAFGAVIVASFFASGPYDWALHSAALLLFVGNLVMLAHYVRVARDQWLESQSVFLASQDNRTQIEELFAMTDMLQAAKDHEDAGAILEATALRLLPQFGGALYVFNNSRDRLDLAKKWNVGAAFDPSETLLPGNCWALKRGKPHINARSSDTLCCMHHVGSTATVEVPMMARGQVHSLIMLSLDSPDAFGVLKEVRRIARALADSMSLALSNFALREKLRTQSLRDPLTGLYNRRYMKTRLSASSALPNAPAPRHRW